MENYFSIIKVCCKVKKHKLDCKEHSTQTRNIIDLSNLHIPSNKLQVVINKGTEEIFTVKITPLECNLKQAYFSETESRVTYICLDIL